MDIEEIRACLPHRYPFLLVDRVTEMDFDNKTIKAYKNVTVNEPFFDGHFPGHSIMPGVLILESMAQVAGILSYQLQNKKASEGFLYYFAGADKVRFKQPVFPGDRLDHEAEFIECRHHLLKFKCRTLVNERVACVAEIMCVERQVNLD
ncbi:3-hydroxyacyl-ACP dehydratase FabZ [Litoribacillus peritrichatus]|uniref:3-hydroxyacyl-[acyl-carrier-protein] dehydratase FabZ n=1 Tax=Litoribacillus peritrichatus TaxID=718191 RepID=A0ABP7N9I0_9GAMM